MPDAARASARDALAGERDSFRSVARQSAGNDAGDRPVLGKRDDWRKVEARLNSFPNFVTTIDGVDIHFIHVRSRRPHVFPVIITHGWPGSIIEQLKITGPLSDPVALGGKRARRL